MTLDSDCSGTSCSCCTRAPRHPHSLEPPSTILVCHPTCLQACSPRHTTCHAVPCTSTHKSFKQPHVEPYVAACYLDVAAGLQRQNISSYYGALDNCLPALSSLSCLTSLQLNCVRQLPLLRHLPNQLQQLSILSGLVTHDRRWGDEEDAALLEVSLDLSHLSELRSLDVQAVYQHITLATDCGLPHSLTALAVPNVSCCTNGGASCRSSVCALLGLTGLQQLALKECSLPADWIVQISSVLTALT
ncbi:hypothetical protein COO60DRAFT_977519 [Scenedesmus sp. NREL 46B-D3]|nr:hypothetical protein COO60DRAFT_977519 [Scenedesmus sp. NREL 46B-D3]